MIMHESHISAVLVAAVDGERVLVVLEEAEQVRHLMNEMTDMFDGTAQEMIRRVTRTNGGERIDLAAGGSVRFAVSTRIRRGDSYDQVFVPLGASKAFRLELEPYIATSKIGLITGY